MAPSASDPTGARVHQELDARRTKLADAIAAAGVAEPYGTDRLLAVASSHRIAAAPALIAACLEDPPLTGTRQSQAAGDTIAGTTETDTLSFEEATRR